MENVLSVVNQIAAGRDAALARSGTAWQGSESAELIASLGQYVDQQLAEQTVRAASLACRRVMPRTSEIRREAYCQFQLEKPVGYSQLKGVYVLELPADLLSVTACRLGGELYEDGRDYYHQDGRLVFNSQPAAGRMLYCYNAILRSRTLSDFWSNVFYFRDSESSADRYYRAFWQIGMTTSSPASFNQLLGAVFDQPSVTLPGQVLRVVEAAGQPPVVCTELETYHGQLGDTATVQVGDELQPGDFVFDGLRTWDAVQPPPVWLTQLTIPAEYFRGIGPLTIRSTPAPPRAAVLNSGGRIHLEIPWEGLTPDINAFNAQLRQFELNSGTRLAEQLDPRASAAELMARSFDWLYVLWSIWLRRGVSVTVVRDKPTSGQMAKYSQVRRAVPPWTTHLIQFLNPPDNYNGSC